MATTTSTPPVASIDPQTLPDDVRLLKDMIVELLVSLHKSQHEIDGLRQRLDQLLRRLYGPRAERWDPKQPLLFPEILAALAAPADAEDQADDSAKEAKTAGRRRQRQGHGRKPLPEHLPRRRQEIDVPLAQKQCPCCGGQRVRIGEETKDQLDYEPASVFVQETVRPKYACPKCTAAGVAVAPVPPQPIDKGLPGPGLLAHVVVSKWADHLPLYRQEHILARQGVSVARSTLGDWAAAAAELLRPVYETMHLSVLQSSVAHTDATPVRVQDEKHPGKTRLGCFWLTIGDTDHPYRVFHYRKTQGQEGPMAILRNFAGFLHADAASALDPVYRALPRIIEVGCWAHARRDFFEAKENHPEAAHQALAHIRRLYAIESEARGLSLATRLRILHEAGDADQEGRLAAMADFAARLKTLEAQVERLRRVEANWEEIRHDATRSVEERLACWDEKELLAFAVAQESLTLVRLKLRRFFTVPKLEAFHRWLEEQGRKADLPKSLFGKAAAYALTNWQALERFAGNGALDIDNNLSERTLRLVALGRKNWLFLGSDAGGKTAEVHLSLVATCKALGIEPFAYLRDLLTRLPTHPPDRLEELLPDRWAQAQRRRLLAEELAKPPAAIAGVAVQPLAAATAVPELAQPPPDVPSG